MESHFSSGEAFMQPGNQGLPPLHDGLDDLFGSSYKSPTGSEIDGLWDTTDFLSDLTCRDPACGCNKVFKTKTKLDRHISKVKKEFQCKEADCSSAKNGEPKCFGTQSDLDRHVRESHSENRHFCPYDGCNRSQQGFPRQSNLDDHLRRLHNHKRPADEPPEADERPARRPKPSAKGKGKAPAAGPSVAPLAPAHVNPRDLFAPGPSSAGPSGAAVAGFLEGAMAGAPLSDAEAGDAVVRHFRAQLDRASEQDQQEALQMAQYEATLRELERSVAELRRKDMERAGLKNFLNQQLRDRLTLLRSARP